MKRKLLSLLAILMMVFTAQAATITVTWNKSDINDNSARTSFTKDGVTVYSDCVDAYGDDVRTSIRNLSSSTGSFTTTLGNFTKIEVTAMNDISGSGWSGNSSKMTWEGEASSSVSFQGSIMGYSGITIVFTIEEPAPAGTALTPDATRKVWTLDAMPAGNVELQVAYFPGMLTLPAKTAQGSIEVVGLGGETLPAGFDTDGTNYYVEPKTQFQVKAVPAEGYHLVSLSDGTNTYDVDADGIATITMPDGDADLTLTATFSDEFELTFDDVNFKTNENITVKVGDAEKTLDQDGKLSVKSGQTVTLTAKQGYKFRSVEAKKAAKAPTTAQLNVPTGWNGDNTNVTANDLPGFVALTDEEAANITCPDAEGYVFVIHNFVGDGYIRIIAFYNGEKQGQQSYTLARYHDEIYYDVNDNQIKYYYTTGK